MCLALGALVSGCTASPVASEAPVLTVSEASLEYGLVDPAVPASRTLVLGNAGATPLGVKVSVQRAIWADAVDWPPLDVEVDCERSGELCVLQPGDEVPVEVGLTLQSLVSIRGGIRIETGSDPRAGAVGDPLWPWTRIPVQGESCSTTADVRLVRPVVDLGRLERGERRSARFIWRHAEGGPVRVVGLQSDCDEVVVALEGHPTGPWIWPGQRFSVRADAVGGGGPLRCTVQPQLESACGAEPVTAPRSTVIANTQEWPEESLRVRIVSPLPGSRVARADTVPIELEVTGVHGPAEDVACVVYNASFARIGSCRLTPGESRVVAEIPASTLTFGAPDIFMVSLGDALMDVQARVAVRLDVDAAADDADGDGSPAGVDCDDSDPTVLPFGLEVFDDVDNDCNGLIDESDPLDLDRDGQTVEEGDCEPRVRGVFRGAVEAQDRIDNDCDGLVDEGTSGFDHDDDGFTVSGGDCDDQDALASPGTPEICGDEVDNDCDRETDERPCAASPGGPPVLTGMYADRVVVPPGAVVNLRALATSPGDAELTAYWSADRGDLERDGALTARWTAPDVEERTLVRLGVHATDPSGYGQSIWKYEDFVVEPNLAP